MTEQNRQHIEQLKARISIRAVAELLGLQPVHGKIRCIHPNRHSHGDRTPSVSLSEEKGLFRCWVCPDVKGDVIELVSQVRNCGFLDAVHWLEDQYPSTSSPLVIQARAPARETATRAKELPAVPVPMPIRPEHWREKAILNFLKLLAPLEQADPHGKFEARDYLVKRKIFRTTWNSMRLRWVDDYGRINDALKSSPEQELLREVGILNEHGNLRFYKHRLILPYLDAQNRPLHFQARATDFDTTPKELSLRGTIPCPYNAKLLDGKPGLVYLCEGPIDTLTLIERGIPAVGVPGVSHLKLEWVPLFAEKTVIVCFDNDEAGRTASEKVIQAFSDGGISASALKALPDGSDINDWFAQNK